jgi:glycosyltransferase involved in cell wall biosynthesis
MEADFHPLPKAVVCHRGSRDYYELAVALAEAGLLETLVTDIYLSPESLPFSQALRRRYPKLCARSHPKLPPSRVITPPASMLDGILVKTPFDSYERQIRLDRSISQRARLEAMRRQSALFSYSYFAAEAFAEGPGRPASRFLFQLHPHPATIRKILLEEMQRHPEFAASLKWEQELGYPKEHFDRLCSESQLANGWVVASTYTAATLAENGIPRDQIHVVPYGVDFTQFPCRTSPPAKAAPFRVMWVGSMAQRKGLSYFLDAIAALPQDDLEVLICGNFDVEAGAIRNRGIRSIRVLKGLPTAALTAELRAADLFVLPSLAEGFGHAIIEALASGLPVLTTTSTCAPDVITDGRHGFIVPIRDVQALVERITWGRAHRAELYQMGLAAAAQVRQFTWERFRKGIVTAYHKMVESNSGLNTPPSENTAAAKPVNSP